MRRTTLPTTTAACPQTWGDGWVLGEGDRPTGMAGFHLIIFNRLPLAHQGFDLRPFLFPAAFDAQFEAIDEVVKACKKD